MGKQWKQWYIWLQNHCRWWLRHGIKKCLLLGRKALTNLDSILKGRDITLPTKFYLVKAMVFPVIMYGCESWTMKKAEGWKIDAFELWCWRRLLRVPWTAGRSNWSFLKEISPRCKLQELVMDREACSAAVHGFTKSWTGLRDRTELNWTEPNMHLYILCSPHSIEYQLKWGSKLSFVAHHWVFIVSHRA